VADFAHSPAFPPGFDPDCFVAAWLAGGGPKAFTLRSDKVIAEGSANPTLADGKAPKGAFMGHESAPRSDRAHPVPIASIAATA
jgi:hypothetical protein